MDWLIVYRLQTEYSSDHVCMCVYVGGLMNGECCQRRVNINCRESSSRFPLAYLIPRFFFFSFHAHGPPPPEASADA